MATADQISPCLMKSAGVFGKLDVVPGFAAFFIAPFYGKQERAGESHQQI